MNHTTHTSDHTEEDKGDVGSQDLGDVEYNAPPLTYSLSFLLVVACLRTTGKRKSSNFAYRNIFKGLHFPKCLIKLRYDMELSN